MDRSKKHRLSTRHLSCVVPSSWIPFDRTTAELKSFKGVIGQERALRAIELGLDIRARGFNIFAAGEPGAGKTSTLERQLKARGAGEPTPKDLCYVHNFSAPSQPRPILLPPGEGRQLARALEKLVEKLAKMVPRVLSDETFGHLRTHILADTHAHAADLTRRASQAAAKLGLSIDEGEENLRVIPLVDGQPMDEEAYQELSPARRNQIEANMLAFQKHLDTYAYKRHQLELDHGERLFAAEVRAITPLVTEIVTELTGTFRRRHDDVDAFVTELERHILDNYAMFMPAALTAEGREEELDPSHGENPLTPFRVNVVVDRTGQRGAPVIMEPVPNVGNLSGYFEYRNEQGNLVTDHTMIRAGCLHQANGGYLLLQVDDVAAQDGAWEILKRSLRHRQVRVEHESAPMETRVRLAGSMKPGAVPLDVKVVLIGSRGAYSVLETHDQDFGRLFKVLADFESSMPRTKDTVTRLSRWLAEVCREEGHLTIHRSGLVRIIEISSRFAEHKERLTTHRARILDLVAEANHYARERRARAIQARDLDRALEENRRRHDAAKNAVDRAIRDGAILLRTSGAEIGQINGIALYELARTSFGVPVRITARVYAGRRGVVNIDREVHLSGAIHEKGGLILVGYLGGRFAQEHVLGLSASITFEQCYDEIDGDSASCAELLALLSALSGCPIRQGIAVTGSVNQNGELQPIGGVNEKIEAVFRVFGDRGLTGEQGVLVPRANIRNLMLSRDVIRAVRAGEFSIYAASTVDEALEVVTGMPAGRRGPKGWPGSTVNGRAARRLVELQEVIQRTGVVTALDRKL